MSRLPFSFGRLEGSVKWLLIANGCVFLAQQVFPGALEGVFGLVPAKVIGNLALWQPFTYLFLHGSFFHLLINMFTLWMFGKELEYLWGTKEFLKFYFICGVGAGFLNVLFDPFSAVPVIGASGAIYGLLVAFALVFPDSLIYLYGVIPMSARHFVILLGAIEFMASFHGSVTPVARFAHLGGMLAGYLYLKSYEFRSWTTRLTHRVLDLFIVRKARPSAPPPAKRQRQEEDLAREVDRILEKVLVQGVDSLTEKEREIMRRYSSTKR